MRQSIEGKRRFSYLHFTLKAVVYAFIVEAFSLPPAILTIGHAGPEGPFAAIGWLGLAINLFGFAVAGRFAPFPSVLRFSSCVLLIQVCFITCLMVVAKSVLLGVRNRR